MRYSCKFAFVGYPLKILTDGFQSKMACLNSGNYGLCGIFGLGLDFGIISLAISQSLSIKVSSWRPSLRLSQRKASVRLPNVDIEKGYNQLCEIATLVVCCLEDDNDFLK